MHPLPQTPTPLPELPSPETRKWISRRIIRPWAVFILVGAGIAVIVFGGPWLRDSNPNVNSFASCVAEGNPVMESAPERCRSKEGLVFVKYDFCTQVITRARNPQTGETREFPTPCDVPEGWVKT